MADQKKPEKLPPGAKEALAAGRQAIKDMEAALTKGSRKKK